MPDAPVAPPDAATAAPTPPAPAETVTRRAPDLTFSEGSYSEEIYLRKPREVSRETPPEERAAEGGAGGQEPPATPEAAPEAKQEPEQQLTAEQLADLSDDDFVSYLEKHPKGKERLERLRENWKGNTEQEIERRTQKRVQEERQKEQAADAYYADVAKLAKEKPEVWEAMTTEGNPAYNKEVVNFVRQYEAWQERRGKPETVREPAIDTEKLTTELLQTWNEEGWKAVKSTIKAEIPFWDKLPSDFRKAVDEDKVQGDKGWWQATVAGLVKSMDSYYKTQIKEAREAGRNEARATSDDDGPVLPATLNNTPVEEMSDREILAAYANNGSRAVPTEVYRAAAKRLKLE